MDALEELERSVLAASELFAALRSQVAVVLRQATNNVQHLTCEEAQAFATLAEMASLPSFVAGLRLEHVRAMGCPECMKGLYIAPDDCVFYATFGQQYPRERHEHAPWAHRDGWVVVFAADRDGAMSSLSEWVGDDGWSMLYDETTWRRFMTSDPPSDHFWPLGQLAVIDSDNVLHVRDAS